MSSTAERLRWVVDTLDPQPGDDVLELGRVRPGRDLRRLMGFLRPGGRLWLFYEAFAPAGAAELERKLRATAATAQLEPQIDRDGRRVAFRLDA